MSEEHLTPEMVRALVRRQMPPGEFVTRAAAHLSSLCPECNAVLSAVLAEENAARRWAGRGEGTGPAREWIAKVQHWSERFDRLREAAEVELEELRSLPPEERRRRLEEPAERCTNPALAERLIEASHRRVTSDPREARELARLAAVVARRIDRSIYAGQLARDLEVRALAYEASALRSAGDFTAAAELFTEARHRLTGSADLLLHGEVVSLMASLAKDRRRFAEGAELLLEAEAIYRRLGDCHLVGKTLVLQADVAYYQGRLEEALALLRKAVEVIDSERDPRLYLSTQHNLAWYLVDLGRVAEAHQIMSKSLDLYHRFPDYYTQLRLFWLQGRIAHARGDLIQAEADFLKVQQGFLHHQLGYDAALVSLDLAMLWSEQGRDREAAAIAAEMIPRLRAHGIDREAMAAQLHFWGAAERVEELPFLAGYFRAG